MAGSLERVATGALTLLIIFVAFAMIIGGKRGARWAINLIFSPIRSYAARRIAAALRCRLSRRILCPSDQRPPALSLGDNH
jgi:hypothetical protein